MLQTVEAIIEKGNHIQFAEPLEFPTTRQRVLVILLNDEYNPLITENNKPMRSSERILHSGFVGCGEAEPTLSENYKSEWRDMLEKKHVTNGFSGCLSCYPC